jgi:hypothetical protein
VDNQKPNNHRCVLLFSGGRDSTIAAVRLNRSGMTPTLVTVSAPHLTGLPAVRERLTELARLGLRGEWIHVQQPPLLTPTLKTPTCLPCQLAYALTGAAIAVRRGIRTLAFGYAQYQSDWPEQSPKAMRHLTQAMASVGLEALFPVADLATRAQAVAELKGLGLSEASLEQKCSLQLTNVALEPHALLPELSAWRELLDRGLERIAALPIDEVASLSLTGGDTP